MDERNSELDVATLREALDSLNDSFSIYRNEDGAPVFANACAKKRFASFYEYLSDGMTNREATFAVLRDRQPDRSEADASAICDKLMDHFYNGTSYTQVSEDGRYIQTSYRKMSNELTAGISVDITDLRNREIDLKKARAEAEAASQSKSAFLANMSHEIRTPLNGIMGMAQVMSGTNLTPEQQEYMSTILESGKTLMSLLNDVLDLSKIEAGKFDIVPVDTDIAHILRRIQKLWKPRAEEKGLNLSLSLDCDLPSYAKIDSVRLQQCVSNLVSNAIKFTNQGRVSVLAKARELDDSNYLIEIEVEDTGCGMDEPTLARLFEPFVQADETISRSHGGTGLGLSITRKLAQMMGGDASATSELGRGSKFVVSIRAAQATSEPRRRSSDLENTPTDARESLKASNLRVLLVDDHPINRQVAGLFLRPFNMRIVEAVNGKEALGALERDTFDLVLLDMHMPIMDGPTTIRHIRASEQRWATIPVIALTADAMSGDKERYLSMGMDGYLSKPLAERDLLTEIMRLRNSNPQLEERRSA